MNYNLNQIKIEKIKCKNIKKIQKINIKLMEYFKKVN